MQGQVFLLDSTQEERPIPVFFSSVARGIQTGKVDTPVKFEAHRKAMAEREWARMEANDSQECRNCHTQESMELSEQSLLAVKNHTAAEKNGETCIQCHKGIAHKLPDMTGVPGWE
ncbi:NapC/NirT family cytochrome c [Endozoicomonas sp. ALD040]|uniref:NapC/NirT family cytochrome c n=1 Tax=unclassified Endozoicomonas TaxID=2644528 RepID=UPI003BB19609